MPTPCFPERCIPERNAQLLRIAPLAADLQIRSWTDLSSPGLAGSPRPLQRPSPPLFNLLGRPEELRVRAGQNEVPGVLLVQLSRVREGALHPHGHQGRHSSGPISPRPHRLAQCRASRRLVQHVRTGTGTSGLGVQGEKGDPGCALSPEPWEALWDSLSWLGAQVVRTVGSVHTSSPAAHCPALV